MTATTTPTPGHRPDPTLPQRALGDGLTVGAIGLGCMGMSSTYGRSDEGESIATIRRALDHGVTLIDTADIYGPYINEQLVGKAIAGRRDEVVLATKFGLVLSENADRIVGKRGDRDYVRSSCEGSLERLGVDHIDLYYVHRVDPSVPVEDTVGFLAELVKDGKIGHIGLSEVTADTLRRAVTEHPIAAVQSEWSLWTRDVEPEVVPTAKELGVGLVPYSPLGRGFLSGQVTSPDDFEPDDARRSQPRFFPENFAHNLDLVAKVRELADSKGCTSGQMALAWLLAQGQNIVPIPGTKRRTYLEENAGAAAVALTPDDLAALESIVPPGAAAGFRYGETGKVLQGGETPPRAGTGQA